MLTLIRQVCQNRRRATGVNQILKSRLCVSVNKCLGQPIVLRLIKHALITEHRKFIVVHFVFYPQLLDIFKDNFVNIFIILLPSI